MFKRSLIMCLIVAVCIFAFLGCKSEGGADETVYPNKAVKLVIPTKPGGDIDQNARLLTAHIEAHLGQTLVAVNQDGGGGNVAIKELLDADADGYQFIMFNTSWFTGLVAGKYDYKVEDLEPVVNIAVNDTLIFAVPADSSLNSAEDLAVALKEKPETVKIAATIGAPSQFHAVAVEKATGGKFKKIDVGSGSDKTVALVSGNIDVLSSTVGLLKDYIAKGDVRAIGNICAKRTDFASDIPTFNESGIDLGPGFGPVYTIWCKPGTPQEIKDKMIEAVKQAMDDEKVKEKFINSMFTPKVMYGDELKQELDEIYQFLNDMKEDIANDSF